MFPHTYTLKRSLMQRGNYPQGYSNANAGPPVMSSRGRVITPTYQLTQDVPRSQLDPDMMGSQRGYIEQRYYEHGYAAPPQAHQGLPSQHPHQRVFQQPYVFQEQPRNDTVFAALPIRPPTRDRIPPTPAATTTGSAAATATAAAPTPAGAEPTGRPTPGGSSPTALQLGQRALQRDAPRRAGAVVPASTGRPGLRESPRRRFRVRRALRTPVPQ